MDDFLVLLQAKLDEAKSKGNVNTDIKELQNQLDKLKVQVELDPKATQKLADSIGKLVNQKIVISNIGINQNNLSKTGQQIGQVISDSAEKAIGNVTSKNIGKYFRVSQSDSRQFQAEMKKLVSGWTNGKGKVTDINIQTRTSFDKDVGENIERLHQATVTYKNELDEVIKKTIAWRQIGTTTNDKGEEKILRGFVEVAGQYSKSIDAASVKTDNFVKKQKETVANMQNTLNQISSRAFDKNSSRPITSDSSLEQLNTQVAHVESAMNDLRNATSGTFDDAKIKVQEEISALKILEKQLRNADNVSTKMKGTDITSGLSIAKNDLEKFKADAKDFPQMIKIMEDLDTAISKVGDASSLNAFNDQLRVARSELAKIKSETSSVNRNEKVGINVSGLQSQIADLQRISPEIDKFETEINGVKVTVESLLTDLSKVNTQSDFSVINSKWKAFTNSAKSAGIAITEVATKSDSLKNRINKIQLSIGDKGNVTTQIKTLSDNFTKLGLSADEVRSKMNGVDTELIELKSLLNSGASNSAIITQFEKMQSVLKETQNDLKTTRSEYSLLVSTQQRLSKANEIEAWNQKNSKATKEVISSNEAYIASLRNLNSQMTKMQFNDIVNGFKQSEISMRGLNKLGASLKDQFSQAAQSFTQWLSVSSGIMLLISKTKDATSEIKELDNILTEISKTSDMTSQQLKQLGMDAYDAASKYGRTASDYLLGVQEMARSGFYGEKGTAMAEQSLLAQSAGDMTADLANNYILATNAAYKLNGESDKLNAVLDGQNSITNRNSVAMADMATAMSEAGTVASSYRVSIEDLSAMIGTIESVTKLGGSEVGNAIKAILINLQNVTSDKIVDTLDAANASMTEFVNGAEKLRNPIDILRDLAKTFNQLDEDDPLRAEILTNIGQKYHAAKLGALLQNMEMFDKMLVDYSEGTGSALEESNKSAENLTGTLNKLHNSWTEFVNGIVESEGLKIGVKLLNGLVEGATSLTSKLGSLGTIGLGAGIFSSIKNVGMA